MAKHEHAVQSKSKARRTPKGARRVSLSNLEVTTRGLPRRRWADLYHLSMTVTWLELFAGFALLFVTFNLVFALLYYLVPGCVANLNPPGYAGAFFFSVETLATVGYGDMHPQTVYGHTVAAVQIFIGMMNLAVQTGIVFARFSRPTARFLFARVAVVRPLDGRRMLMLRAANERQNVIVEASARLRMIQDSVSSEGYRLRRITDLRLIRDQQPLFVLGWNLMHIIDESSPLFGETEASLAERNTAFSLTMSGTDETTGQVLVGRIEYPSHAIRWSHTFLDVLTTEPDGSSIYDYSRFHDVEPLPPDP